jgi:hypothetical protein
MNSLAGFDTAMVRRRAQRWLLASLLLSLGVPGCRAETAPAPQRTERFSLETTPDGGFTAILRGSSAKSFDGPRDVEVDGAGNIIVVGGTESADFPTTPGAHQTTFSTGGKMLGGFPPMDVFVTKLHPDGTIAWSTFLGGPNYDRAYAVEVDGEDDIYVAGRAGAGFPTTPGALQREFAGDRDPNPAYGPQDGFVAKLSRDGRLLWATYLGDPSGRIVRDLAVDAEGNAYAALVGRGEFPYVEPGAWQARPAGGYENVVAALDAGGTRVVWATYLAGAGDEGNPTLRLDAQGRIVVLTCSDSDDWAAHTTGFQRKRAGGKDLLILRLSRKGALEVATYLGGSGNDVTETHHLALDPQGRVALGVATQSRDLPVPGDSPFRRSHGPEDHDGYAALLSPDLDALLAATYVGHRNKSGGIEGVAIDGRGNVSIGGATGGGLPTTPDAAQPEFAGDRDAYVARLAPDLGSARYLSYWGTPAHEGQRALQIDAAGNIVSVGQTAGDVFVKRFMIPGSDESRAGASR